MTCEPEGLNQGGARPGRGSGRTIGGVGTARSPRIETSSWGRLVVEGADRPYKDGKLYPGGAREWDWRETGTAHSPGIQTADLEEILAHGAEVVVLSRGVLGRLGVGPEALAFLEDEGVEVHVHRTKEAVRIYNRLRETRAVGALIHSTC